MSSSPLTMSAAIQRVDALGSYRQAHKPVLSLITTASRLLASPVREANTEAFVSGLDGVVRVMRSRDQVVEIEDVVVSIDYVSDGHRVHVMKVPRARISA